MATTIKLRRGTNANRTGITPANGEIIYTTDTNQLYVGDGSTAGGILVSGAGGGGATGGGSDAVFWENDTNVTTNYTITSGKNAGTFGPVTIDTGVTVTVPSGSVWTIV